MVKAFLRKSSSVISVDAKKKEHLGNRLNKGAEWRKKGSLRPVDDHDFPTIEGDIAILYGVYDIGGNSGWVNVRVDNETSVFAVQSIMRWWQSMGRKIYLGTPDLLICVDSGGSNGYNRRLWRFELQQLTNKLDVKITVCHLPPGTSKWKKI